MSKLEKIVPSLRLCKKIPTGEFRNTALAWRFPACDKMRRGIVQEWQVIEVNWYAVEKYGALYPEHGEEFYPAPTLEEIRWELRNMSVSAYENTIVASCKIDPETWVSETVNPGEHDADAALRLWFKVKGVEVEK